MRRTIASIATTVVTVVAVVAVSMAGLAVAQTPSTGDGVPRDAAVDRGHPRLEERGVRRGAALEDLAAFLGVDRGDLVARLRGGETLAAIAAGEGVSREALVEHLVARVTERFDAAVAEGRIDAARRDGIVERVSERLQARVDASWEDRREKKAERHRREGRARGAEILADALGMTVDEMRAALEGGSTVAELAERRGVAVDDLVDALIASIEGRVATAVREGKIDAARAAERLAEIRRRIAERLDP